MSLKGTKTAKNLMISFAGESQARTRYTYYASEAKKEGYVQISNIFMETAENEKEHAKRFMKFLREELEGEAIEVNWNYRHFIHNHFFCFSHCFKTYFLICSTFCSKN